MVPLRVTVLWIVVAVSAFLVKRPGSGGGSNL